MSSPRDAAVCGLRVAVVAIDGARPDDPPSLAAAAGALGSLRLGPLVEAAAGGDGAWLPVLLRAVVVSVVRYGRLLQSVDPGTNGGAAEGFAAVGALLEDVVVAGVGAGVPAPAAAATAVAASLCAAEATAGAAGVLRCGAALPVGFVVPGDAAQGFDGCGLEPFLPPGLGWPALRRRLLSSGWAPVHLPPHGFGATDPAAVAEYFEAAPLHLAPPSPVHHRCAFLGALCTAAEAVGGPVAVDAALVLRTLGPAVLAAHHALGCDGVGRVLRCIAAVAGAPAARHTVLLLLGAMRDSTQALGCLGGALRVAFPGAEAPVVAECAAAAALRFDERPLLAFAVAAAARGTVEALLPAVLALPAEPRAAVLRASLQGGEPWAVPAEHAPAIRAPLLAAAAAALTAAPPTPDGDAALSSLASLRGPVPEAEMPALVTVLLRGASRRCGAAPAACATFLVDAARRWPGCLAAALRPPCGLPPAAEALAFRSAAAAIDAAATAALPTPLRDALCGALVETLAVAAAADGTPLVPDTADAAVVSWAEADAVLPGPLERHDVGRAARLRHLLATPPPPEEPWTPEVTAAVWHHAAALDAAALLTEPALRRMVAAPPSGAAAAALGVQLLEARRFDSAAALLTAAGLHAHIGASAPLPSLAARAARVAVGMCPAAGDGVVPWRSAVGAVLSFAVAFAGAPTPELRAVPPMVLRFLLEQCALPGARAPFVAAALVAHEPALLSLAFPGAAHMAALGAAASAAEWLERGGAAPVACGQVALAAALGPQDPAVAALLQRLERHAALGREVLRAASHDASGAAAAAMAVLGRRCPAVLRRCLRFDPTDTAAAQGPPLLDSAALCDLGAALRAGGDAGAATAALDWVWPDPGDRPAVLVRLATLGVLQRCGSLECAAVTGDAALAEAALATAAVRPSVALETLLATHRAGAVVRAAAAQLVADALRPEGVLGGGVSDLPSLGAIADRALAAVRPWDAWASPAALGAALAPRTPRPRDAIDAADGMADAAADAVAPWLAASDGGPVLLRAATGWDTGTSPRVLRRWLCVAAVLTEERGDPSRDRDLAAARCWATVTAVLDAAKAGERGPLATAWLRLAAALPAPPGAHRCAAIAADAAAHLRRCGVAPLPADCPRPGAASPPSPPPVPLGRSGQHSTAPAPFFAAAPSSAELGRIAKALTACAASVQQWTALASVPWALALHVAPPPPRPRLLLGLWARVPMSAATAAPFAVLRVVHGAHELRTAAALEATAHTHTMPTMPTVVASRGLCDSALRGAAVDAAALRGAVPPLAAVAAAVLPAPTGAEASGLPALQRALAAAEAAVPRAHSAAVEPLQDTAAVGWLHMARLHRAAHGAGGPEDLSRAAVAACHAAATGHPAAAPGALLLLLCLMADAARLALAAPEPHGVDTFFELPQSPLAATLRGLLHSLRTAPSWRCVAPIAHRILDAHGALPLRAHHTEYFALHQALASAARFALQHLAGAAPGAAGIWDAAGAFLTDPALPQDGQGRLHLAPPEYHVPGLGTAVAGGAGSAVVAATHLAPCHPHRGHLWSLLLDDGRCAVVAAVAMDPAAGPCPPVADSRVAVPSVGSPRLGLHRTAAVVAWLATAVSAAAQCRRAEVVLAAGGPRRDVPVVDVPSWPCGAVAGAPWCVLVLGVGPSRFAVATPRTPGTARGVAATVERASVAAVGGGAVSWEEARLATAAPPLSARLGGCCAGSAAQAWAATAAALRRDIGATVGLGAALAVAGGTLRLSGPVLLEPPFGSGAPWRWRPTTALPAPDDYDPGVHPEDHPEVRAGLRALQEAHVGTSVASCAGATAAPRVAALASSTVDACRGLAPEAFEAALLAAGHPSAPSAHTADACAGRGAWIERTVATLLGDAACVPCPAAWATWL